MKTSKRAQAVTSHSLIIVRESGLMQGVEEVGSNDSGDDELKEICKKGAGIAVWMARTYYPHGVWAMGRKKEGGKL